MLSFSLSRVATLLAHIFVLLLVFVGVTSGAANGKVAIRHDISARNLTKRQSASISPFYLANYNGGASFYDITCYDGGSSGSGCSGAITDAAAAAIRLFPQYCLSSGISNCFWGAYGVYGNIPNYDKSGITVSLAYEILDVGSSASDGLTGFGANVDDALSQSLGSVIESGLQYYDSTVTCAELFYNGETIAYLGFLFGWNNGGYDCDGDCITGVVQACT